MMASHVGNCIGCTGTVDHDDPTVLVIHGHDRDGRILDVACSWKCLTVGANTRWTNEIPTPPSPFKGEVDDPSAVIKFMRDIPDTLIGWAGLTDDERNEWRRGYQQAMDGLVILLARIPKPRSGPQ